MSKPKVIIKKDSNGNVVSVDIQQTTKFKGDAGVDGKAGKDGIDGKVGKTGQNGLQGEPGLIGKDGKDYNPEVEKQVEKNTNQIISAEKTINEDILTIDDNLLQHENNFDIHFDDKEQKDKVLDHLESKHDNIIISGGGTSIHNNIRELQGGDPSAKPSEFYHLNKNDHDNIANDAFLFRDGHLPMTGPLDLDDNNITNVNYIDFKTDASLPAHKEARMFYDSNRKGWSVYIDEPDVKGDLLEEVWVNVRNETGSTILNGSVVRVTGANSGLPLVELAKADSSDTVNGVIGIATHDIHNAGSNGYVTVFGQVHNLDTSACNEGDVLYVSPDVAGEWTAVRPINPNYAIQIGQVNIADLTGGVVHVNVIGQVTDIQINSLNGSNIEPFSFIVDSDGINVTGLLTSDTSDNITLVLDGELIIFDANPAATIDLTSRVGTDEDPVDSFVYIPNSTRLLTVGSVWPSEQHVKIANISLWSITRTQTKGAMVNRNHNNHVAGTDNQGHSEHISNWIRNQNASWISGASLSVSGSGTSNIDFSVTSGVVLQLHEQSFPSLDTITGDIEIVNDFNTPYLSTNDPFTDITSDSTGTTIGTNKYFNLVIFGVQNKTGTTSHLMCNLPSGFYTSETTAKIDGQDFSNYNIPSNANGVGFLIAELTFQLKVGSWELVQEKDLRGREPGIQGGGTSSLETSSFFDGTFNISNTIDDSKVLDFDIQNVATATTRTITMADRDLDLTNPIFDTITTAGLTWLGTSTADFSDAPKTIHIDENIGGALIIKTDEGTPYEYFNLVTNPGGTGTFNFGNTSGNPGYNFLGSGVTTLGGDLWVNGGTISTTETELTIDEDVIITGDLDVNGGITADTFNTLYLTSGTDNVAVTSTAIPFAGTATTIVGAQAGVFLTSGDSNSFFGNEAGKFYSTSSNLTTASNCTLIGCDTETSANGVTNETVIGCGAIGKGDNTVSIGNTSVQNNYFNGTLNVDKIDSVSYGGITVYDSITISNPSGLFIDYISPFLVSVNTFTQDVNIIGDLDCNSDVLINGDLEIDGHMTVGENAPLSSSFVANIQGTTNSPSIGVGVLGSMTHSKASSTTSLYGGFFASITNAAGAGTITNMNALLGQGIYKDGSFPITTANILRGNFSANSSYTGTITELNLLNLLAAVDSGGTITTMHGILIDDITFGEAGNNYAIKTGLGDVSFGDDVNIVGNIQQGSTEIIDNNGYTRPITSTDALAPNNSFYYSSTQSKLVYKDSGGTVNNLY